MTTPIFPTGPGALPQEVTCDSFKDHLREIAKTFDSGSVGVHDVCFPLRVAHQMAEALKASPKAQNRQMAESWLQSEAGKISSAAPFDPKLHGQLILDWLGNIDQA